MPPLTPRLYNTLTVPAVPGRGVVTVAHGLTSGAADLEPDIVCAPGFGVTATATTITLTNLGPVTLDAEVALWHWHSIHRALGGDADPSIQPYVLSNDTNALASNILLPSAVPARIKLYARTTGSDVTGTGTLANPYRTVIHALSTIPVFIPAGVIYVVDGTGIVGVNAEIIPDDYRWPTFIANGNLVANLTPDNPAFVAEGPITLQGIPVVADTVTALEITATTPNARTGLITLTTTKNYLLNEHRGKIAIGAGLFQVATIASNSAGPNSTIELCTSVALTAPIQIVTAGLELRNGAAASVLPTINFLNSQAIVALNGVKLSHANPAAFATGCALSSLPQISMTCCFLDGIQLDGNQGRRALLYGVSFTTGKETRWDGVAVFLRRSFFPAVDYKNGLGGASTPGVMECVDCIFDGCNSVGQSGSNLSTGALVWSHVVVRNCAGTGMGLRQGTATHRLEQVQVNNSGVDGIAMSLGAICQFVNVSGTGNAGFGLRLQQRALALVDAALTDITGTGGDMVVGALATRTWVNFHGFAPVNNEIDSTATGDMSQVRV